MIEVAVHRERFRDSVRFHDHETDAVSEAVLLVAVANEVLESSALFAGRGVMDTAERASVQLSANFHGDIVRLVWISVRARSQDRDGFFDHVVRGESEGSKILISKLLHDFENAPVVLVSLRNEREQKTCVEKDHRGRRLP